MACEVFCLPIEGRRFTLPPPAWLDLAWLPWLAGGFCRLFLCPLLRLVGFVMHDELRDVFILRLVGRGAGERAGEGASLLACINSTYSLAVCLAP